MGEAATAYVHESWLRPSKTRSNKPPIEGLYFIKRSMTRKVIQNPTTRVSMQCMQGEDGSFYYIPLDSYDPSHLEIIHEMSPILVNPMPSQFEPGAMYTYIIASIITKDTATGMDKQLEPMKLYASKAMNMFEFGTKHHQIFYRMSQTGELDHVAQENGIPINMLQYGLHASGEIRCINENTLEFNFFSGTYKMKRKIPKRRAKYEMALMTHLMHTIDPSYNIMFDFKPFILPELMPITHEQIKRLESRGLPVFSFKTREQCRDMRIAIIRHKNIEKKDMTYEEMTKKYEQMMNPPPAPAPTNAYIMGRDELEAYAAAVNAAAVKAAAAAGECDVPMPIPIPVPPYDKNEFRKIIKAHMDANKGKGGGGKQRTLKKKMMCKKKMTMKKRK